MKCIWFFISVEGWKNLMNFYLVKIKCHQQDRWFFDWLCHSLAAGVIYGVRLGVWCIFVFIYNFRHLWQQVLDTHLLMGYFWSGWCFLEPSQLPWAVRLYAMPTDFQFLLRLRLSVRIQHLAAKQYLKSCFLPFWTVIGALRKLQPNGVAQSQHCLTSTRKPWESSRNFATSA